MRGKIARRRPRGLPGAPRRPRRAFRLTAAPGSATDLRQVVLRPNRCDAHALGEDKQGTYFDVDVTLPDGRTGRYSFGVDPEQRGKLYRLYARKCGLS